MFMPTHNIYLVKQNGERVSVSITDCSTKQEVRQEAKELLEQYYDDKIEEYAKVQYVDKNDKVLYECTVEECLNEK